MGKYKDARELKTGYCLTQKQIDNLSLEEKENRKKSMLESRNRINEIEKNQELLNNL